MPILLAPMYVPETLAVQEMLMGPRRHGIPTLLGWRGHAPDGEAVQGVDFDWPDHYRPLSEVQSQEKRRNELRQMRRLRADLKRDRADPFRSAQAAEVDPPDFVCEAPVLGGRVGVELTQLTLEERAESHALFRSTRSRLIARIAKAPASYAHLRGDLMTVYFSDHDGRPRKPVQRPDGEDTLLAALRDYERPPSPGAELLETLDPTQIMEFDGGSLSGMELPGLLTTSTFQLLGFELALASFSVTRQNEAWSKAAKLIGDHDKPGVELLVLISGSPTSNGVAFPGDMVLVRGVLEAATVKSVQTDHIRRIWIHSWPERVVYEMRPGRSGTKVVAGTPIDLSRR